MGQAGWLNPSKIGPQGLEYTEKLYKQAQRTHRIVQNLLSFARQHKPERAAVQINQILQETLALRDNLNRLERSLLVEAHRRAHGVRREAARLLGIDARNLAYYCRKHGLDFDSLTE